MKGGLQVRLWTRALRAESQHIDAARGPRAHARQHDTFAANFIRFHDGFSLLSTVLESRNLPRLVVDREDYRSHGEARQSLFEYIEVFYNRQRRHSHLDYLSPVQYEAIHASL